MSPGSIAFEFKTLYNLLLHVQTIDDFSSYMIEVNPWDVQGGRLEESLFFAYKYADFKFNR
ncbi:MAG: hypothetical protein A3B43_00755 [Candidatus Levybacteria bacterium RIFCSPLOWO2_01_FULL_38_120]|nr:MAG: hypothetical protein A3B43_00755 [Candidatus Levybacteria bacterium RIFCSPLOWO2_01_FULL_38_120]